MGFNRDKLQLIHGPQPGQRAAHAQDEIEVFYPGVGRKRVRSDIWHNAVNKARNELMDFEQNSDSVVAFQFAIMASSDKFWKRVFEILEKEDQYVQFEDVRLCLTK
jgi:hypothetical protein